MIALRRGDWVRHSISHLLMRVEDVSPSGEDVYCSWTIDGHSPKRTMFAAELLERAERPARLVGFADEQSGVHDRPPVR